MLETIACVALAFAVGILAGLAIAWDKAFTAGRRHERAHPARAFQPLDGLSEVL